MIPESTTLAERLKTSHPSMPAIGREVWQSFVAKAIGLLERVEERLKDESVWVTFANREGWWLPTKRKVARDVLVKVPGENAITHAIEEIASQILRETRPDDPLTDHLRLDAQVVRPPHHRIGSSALTTDIRITSCQIQDLEIRLEAKLLFSSGDLKSHYLGAKGLLRFADSKAPYTDKPVGCMLGYRLRHSQDHWDGHIFERLEDMTEVTSLGSVDVGGRKAIASELEWGEGDACRVMVLHLGMDYETDPSCRP